MFVDEPLLNGIYKYRLKQVDYDGTFEYSNEIEISVILVKDFALYQNYPNPFNPATTISYQLPEASLVSIKVFDALGTELETLINKFMPAGVHEVTFDGSNFSSGIYFYGIQSEKLNKMKKMILLK